jgi:hypothetical protein
MKALLHLALAAPCAVLIATLPASGAQRQPSGRYCAAEAGEGRFPPGCPGQRRRVSASPPGPPARPRQMVRPGIHSCQISAEYRFRPCRISQVASGEFEFTFSEGLMGIQGSLTRQGSTLLFVGRLIDDSPFLCNYGTRQLSDWSSTFDRCRSQTITVTLRRSGRGWSGDLTGLTMRTEYGYNSSGARVPVSHSLVPYDQWPLPLTILD